ncbi:hypothetical protein B0T14DRAFT_330526 [Immersiella caudata]|uniref:Uncharacterized protein n=1 Tax=Immersiella caudata TaxID=314043 RepID=A0AA39WC15_9PEZI|nr:hypothetical protein B0T14DRAFT_330526 [Immersiella caudata]
MGQSGEQKVRMTVPGNRPWPTSAGPMTHPILQPSGFGGEGPHPPASRPATIRQELSILPSPGDWRLARCCETLAFCVQKGSGCSSCSELCIPSLPSGSNGHFVQFSFGYEESRSSPDGVALHVGCLWPIARSGTGLPLHTGSESSFLERYTDGSRLLQYCCWQVLGSGEDICAMRNRAPNLSQDVDERQGQASNRSASTQSEDFTTVFP